jgi:hypothetical protein
MYVDKDMPETKVTQMQLPLREKPWIQRKDWAAGKVNQEGAGKLKYLIAFTVLWNIIAFGITAVAIFSQWGTGYVPYFVLIFPLIGIVLIIVSIRTWIRKKKFGISILDLETIPAFLGEKLQGTIVTGVSTAYRPPDGFRVRLVCNRRSSYRDKDGDRHVKEEQLWRTEQSIHSHFYAEGHKQSLSVYFSIPSDLPPTELFPEDDRIVWRLEVSASVPGIDYTAQFEVPVFKRESVK